jgi:ABC-type methionine transport system permease subunit
MPNNIRKDRLLFLSVVLLCVLVFPFTGMLRNNFMGMEVATIYTVWFVVWGIAIIFTARLVYKALEEQKSK